MSAVGVNIIFSDKSSSQPPNESKTKLFKQRYLNFLQVQDENAFTQLEKQTNKTQQLRPKKQCEI